MEEIVHIPGIDMSAEYDSFGDVLYVNDGNPRVGFTKDDGGLILRYDAKTHEVVGFTLEDFVLYWSIRVNELMGKLSIELKLNNYQSEIVRVKMRELVEHAKLKA